MSSYLTIYGVPKNEGKPIDIVSFSRSHCIYSAICDEVNVAWAQFYQEFMETLDIPEHISNREGSTTITIRICRREILQLLQDVITNNNLFHLKRKWNKLMIKEPSASES